MPQRYSTKQLLHIGGIKQSIQLELKSLAEIDKDLPFILLVELLQIEAQAANKLIVQVRDRFGSTSTPDQTKGT